MDANALKDRVGEEVGSDDDESIFEYIRGAVLIRLYTENDEEYLAEARDELDL